MLLLDVLAEQRITQALEAGAFDNLPGAGQPLPEEDDMSLVPAEQRMAWRILKNAGYIPPELVLHKEAVAIALQLATTGCTDSQHADLQERLLRINLLLAEAGRNALSVPADYAARLADRLAMTRRPA
ncbi:DnaJ family domain-containing protein [Uliginosibacterium sp. H1]|uniref:DnaJ family domain-containing protein n=1 Tax=Uliginosibacterium sp. H1 TaxID=3114757 RepID=UPI002E17D0C1|nr:DnaJ family domain-containing protein [Uliginosibacterium sp. H1]